MSTATEIHSGSVALWDVSRDFYERFLEEFKDRYVPHAYDEEVLEIVSPVGLEHEGSKKLLSWVVQTLAEELRTPIRCVGSLTKWNRREAKGIEPDECFYIANEAAMRGRSDFNLDRDGPPDLAIEVDWMSASLPRLPIYARLGTPEVWRYAKERLTVHCLTRNGEYEESDRSQSIPFLPLEEFQKFTLCDPDIDERSWIRRLREWVRMRLSHHDSEQRAWGR
jgi:Uma2 family endonuclease